MKMILTVLVFVPPKPLNQAICQGDLPPLAPLTRSPSLLSQDTTGAALRFHSQPGGTPLEKQTARGALGRGPLAFRK